jgi:hypothetical protein
LAAPEKATDGRSSHRSAHSDDFLALVGLAADFNRF